MNELHKMTLKELIKYCKYKNIKGYSGKNKSSLFSFIEENNSKNIIENKSKNIIENKLKNNKVCSSYNAYELICTIVLCSYYKIINEHIKTYDDLFFILENIYKYKNVLIQNKEKYIENLLNLNRMNILKYINILLKELDKLPKVDVHKIYLCGHKEFPEIKIINKQLTKNEKKGDIYLELINGKFISFSIKQNEKCTKTNWSIEKIIDNQNELKNCRNKYLIDSGFQKHDNNKREFVNKLFYNSDNPYFKKLKEFIELKKQLIINEFKNKLYGNTPYILYEFNSNILINLSSIKINDITFEEHIPYYYNNSGKRRQCAKLFYKLKINDNIYRVEVRWKGNIHNASPQFQTHYMNTDFFI